MDLRLPPQDLGIVDVGLYLMDGTNLFQFVFEGDDLWLSLGSREEEDGIVPAWAWTYGVDDVVYFADII